MSILEKIVKTEVGVQKQIEDAKKESKSNISKAREKFSLEAETIRSETNIEIEKINKEYQTKITAFDNSVQTELEKQNTEFQKSVKAKLTKTIDKLVSEVVKVWLFRLKRQKFLF